MADNKYNISLKIDSSSVKNDSEKVKRYLEQIQKEAKQMQKSINKSFKVDSSASVSEINDISESLDDVSSHASQASSSVSNSMSDIEKKASSASEKFKKFGSVASKIATSSIAVASAIAIASSRAAEYAKEIESMANRSSTSVEEIQRLQFAFRSIGVDGEQMSQMFKDAQDKIGDFDENGAGPLVDFFNNIAKPMGQTIDDFKNLTGPEIMQKYIKMLKESGASQSDMIFYMEAIASESTDLIPLFEKGADSIEKMKDRANELNIVLSKEELNNLKDIGSEMSELKNVMDGTMNKFIASFSKEIIQATNAMTSMFTLAAEGLMKIGLANKSIENFTLAKDMQEELLRLDEIIEEQKKKQDQGLVSDIYDKWTDFTVWGAAKNLTEGNLNLEEAISRREALKNKYDEIWKTGNRESEIIDYAKELKNFGNDDIDAGDGKSGVSSSSLNGNDEEEKKAKDLAESLKYLQAKSYETKISLDVLKDAQSEIIDKNLYPFYDTMSQKMSAYIKDNKLIKKSESEVKTSKTATISETQKAIVAINKEIESLQKANDVYGMTNSEVLDYSLNNGELSKSIDLLGDSGKAAAKKMIDLRESLDSKEAMSDMKEEIKGLNLEIKAMGLSGADKIDFNVSNEFEDQIEQLGDKGVEAKNKIVALRQEIENRETAQSFIDDSISDVDMLKSKIEELNSVSEYMTKDQFSSISENLKSELELAKIEADDFKQFMFESGQDVRESFTSAISEGLNGDFDSMFDSLQQTVTNRLSEILSNQLFDQLQGSLGFGGTDSSSGFSSFLSGIFAGRQSGGHMTSGQSYLVGEKGPEIITPTSPSYATSNSSLRNGSGGNTTINLGGISVTSNSATEARRAESAVNAAVAKAVRNAQSRGDI